MSIINLPLSIIISLCCISCGPEHSIKQRARITLQVIPEDEQQHAYTISWKDTFGKKERYSVSERPVELWCTVIGTSGDTLGWYRGLSTPFTFVVFRSKDTIVTLHFAAGMNLFSTVFATDAEARRYYRKKKIPLQYKPLGINLRKNVRKDMVIVLEEK